MARLSRGDRVFYPAENEGEVGPALRAAAAERGIALIPVATVADAISSLLHAHPAAGQGGELSESTPRPESEAEAAGIAAAKARGVYKGRKKGTRKLKPEKITELLKTLTVTQIAKLHDVTERTVYNALGKRD
jgi:hypothetical protein